MTQLYLTMPQPGETITEGTIVSWLVKPGDIVQEAAPLAELETEKAVFEYESPFEGKLVQLLHEEGQRVKVAEPIAVIECDDEKAQMYQMMGIAKLVEGSPVQVQSVSAEERPQVKTPESTASVSAKRVTAKVSAPAQVSDVKMSPYVRRNAMLHQVESATLIKLADAEGRVTKEAIDRFIESGAVPEAKSTPVQSKPSVSKPAHPAQGEFRAESCSAIRMRIADNMVESKLKIPHAHNGIAVDVTDVVEFRDARKAEFKQKNASNLNFLTLIYPALVDAIQKYPMINASYDDSTSPHQIRFFEKINLGVAVGSEHGLVIPVIHDIASLSLLEFNRQLNEKIDKAQNKKLMPDDLMGATLIFNNFGFFGTQLGVQVIQYPMAATLGMGTIEKRVVPVNKGTEIGIRTMTDVVLSFDHRVMDGRETGLFLAHLKKGMESFDSQVLPV